MNENNVTQRDRASNQRKTITKKLHKYSLGSQSLAVLSGVMGQVAICSATVMNLDVGILTNGETLNASGTGTLGTFVSLSDDNSYVNDDAFHFSAYAFNYGFISTGGSGNFEWAFDGETFDRRNIKYFPMRSSVDSSSTFFPEGFFTNGLAGGNLGDWTINRPNGAIGFRNGDGEFGYMLVSWVAATKTLTFLGLGAFDDSPGTGITVVPEPAEYAVALGLGVLGLTYYRRRAGNKTRPKNN